MTTKKIDIEIEGRHKNTLLHREEFNFEILNTSKTPARPEVRTALSGKLGADEVLIVIDEIEHEFGSTRVVGFAKRYDSIEDLKRVEPAYMQKKHEEKKDKSTESKPAEAKHKEAKPIDTEPVDTKPTDTKPAEKEPVVEPKKGE